MLPSNVDRPRAPDSSWSRELDAAVDAVGAAAGIARQAFYAGSSGVEDKADLTPVSDADRESEARMKRLLRKRFPHDTVIGEEASSGGEPPSGRVWLLDAIDGTNNAITGVNPLFVSQACLLVDGEPAVAAIELPITGQLFTAVEGRGAFLRAAGGKVPLEVSRQTDLSQARVLVGMGSAPEDGEWLARAYTKLVRLGNPSSPRHPGSSGYELCLVAAGGLSPRGVDAKIDYGSQSWDLAPGVLLARESGGVAFDLRGGDWGIGSKSLVAGGRELAHFLLAHLSEGDPA